MHQGEHYNLQEIYDQINREYFEGKLSLQITWSGMKNHLPKRKVILGSYHQDQALIRIHRRLDQAHVPYHFISFIVYHEMLHHVLPPLKRTKNGRRIHHPEFVEQEKQFKEYELVKETKKSLKKGWFAVN